MSDALGSDLGHPHRMEAPPTLGPPGTNAQASVDAAAGWWIEWAARGIEATLGGPPVAASLSAYVHQGREFITCDLSGETGDRYEITMVIAGVLRLGAGDPYVVDAVSAICLAGRLLARWSLTASVGGPIGV